MEYRFLGSTGLRVSVLGLGCDLLGDPTSGLTRGDTIRLLEHAADLGVTFYDTADVYAEGESERLLGEVFGRGGRRVVIATKIGSSPRVSGRLLALARPSLGRLARLVPRVRPSFTRARRALRGKDFTPAHLRRAAERCLERLRMDCLDLLQLHSPPVTMTQEDDAFETLERLRAEGAIRFYGASFTTGPERVPTPAGAGMSTLQIPIDVVDDAAVRGVRDWAAHRGLGVIGNQPFKKGWLLRAAKSRRGGQPGTDGTRSVAQAALRAVTQLSDVSVVVAGTTSLAHLRENAAAIDTPPLTPEELRRLRSALSAG